MICPPHEGAGVGGRPRNGLTIADMPDQSPLPPPAETLRAAYRAFGDVVAAMDDDRSWLPTGCTGWSVRDLVFHCLCDAQRGLVALHSPTDRAVDRDAITYWQGWRADNVGAANGRRFTRVVASMFLQVDQLRELYLQTATAVLNAAPSATVEDRIETQGHVLTIGDLMRTLAVEATIHHLDMIVCLPAAPEPSREGLAQVRWCLDGLWGRAAAATWSDAHYARMATGRTPMSQAEREQLGADATHFPLFG